MRVWVVLMQASHAGKPDQVETVRIEGAFMRRDSAVAWCQSTLKEEGYRVFEPVVDGQTVYVMGSVLGDNWRIKRFNIDEHQVDKLIGVVS